MKKKLIVCIMALGLLAGCGKQATLKNGEETLVEFKDGTKYSVDEVWTEMKDNYALQVILEKIDSKILGEEFKDKKKEAENYIKGYESSLKANYVDENGNFDENALNNALTQYGYSSIDVLLKQQETKFYTDLATKEYAKKQITEKQAKDYYNKKSIGDIKAVHILVKSDGTDAQADKDAKNKATEIIKAIKADVKSGTSILDAFKKYESNKDVTYQDLGYFNRGEMVEAFENAVIEMKANSYSTTPVKTSYGYHIIYKIEQKEKSKYEDIKDSIKDTLADDYISENKTAEVNAMIELRKQYGVKIDDDSLQKSYDRYMNYLINQDK